MWSWIGAFVAAAAYMAVAVALLAAGLLKIRDVPENLAARYGRGPASRWLLEWGSFAGILFLEILCLGVVIGGGGLAMKWYTEV